MSVQATFISGGLAISVQSHHSVMDAQCIATFVSTWSKHVVAASHGTTAPQSMDEEDNDLLQDLLDGTDSVDAPPLSEFPTYVAPKERPYAEKQAKINPLSLAYGFEGIEHIIKRSHWELSPSSLALLKKYAAPSSTDQVSATESAIITALIWRHITRARRLQDLDIKTSSAICPVNGRRILDPPLPLSCPGNTVVASRATATVIDLVSAEVSLHNLAVKVVDSVDWWNSDRILALAATIQSLDSVDNMVVPPLDYDITVSHTTQIGRAVWDSSWGAELGSAKALRVPFPAFMDGFNVVLPTADGGYDITMFTTHDTTDQISMDYEWTKWATRLD